MKFYSKELEEIELKNSTFLGKNFGIDPLTIK